jgi:site-specific recombinase XerD
MSDHRLQRSALLAQFEGHLAKARYSLSAAARYLAVARNFLEYLTKRHVPIDTADPKHITKYLRCELRRFVRRHGQAPICIDHWRASHTSGIHQLLRLINGSWSPAAATLRAGDVFCPKPISEYTQWLDERRGLAKQTIVDLAAEARRFLLWYGRRKGADRLSAIAITDLDAYLQARAPSMRRRTLASVAQRLRCFLRFAHASGRTERDLAPSVMAPRLYALESIPSALRAEEIHAVLQSVRQDRSAKGLRDYAILLFLSTYGLRAGEIARLRLDDIDWRTDRLWVRHTKTGAQSILPLLPAVGEALLAYLRRGRPETEVREVFVRAHAPYQGFADGSSLYTLVRRRLDAAGVQPAGKRGPHAFRHARAVSLLRCAVPLKIIGDVLGHQSASSTTPYLKLATEELRDVALEIPARLGGDQP